MFITAALARVKKADNKNKVKITSFKTKLKFFLITRRVIIPTAPP